jgi:hypothetical protein
VYIRSALYREIIQDEFAFTTKHCGAVWQPVKVIVVEMIVGYSDDVSIKMGKGLWKPELFLRVAEGIDQ